MTWPEQEGFSGDRFNMLVSGNMLLVNRGNVEDIDNEDVPPPNADADGIYVFDLENFSRKQFVRGDFETFAKGSDDPSTIVATRGLSLDVFKLSGGCLTRTVTVARWRDRVLYANVILLVFQSRVYVRDTFRNRIKVYSTLNRELLRTIDPPAFIFKASTIGRELFLGFGTLYAEGDGLPSVRAYCLGGY